MPPFELGKFVAGKIEPAERSHSELDILLHGALDIARDDPDMSEVGPGVFH
jgi:hypothetical protein